MSCRKERIEIPIGSDFKLIVQLTRIDGTAIPPDSVAWELRFASREKLYANYIVKSSELGDRWHEVEGSDKILIPIPSDHSMAPGELCCKIRYSTPDAQFSDDSYDAESTWRIVELGGDGGYSLTLVSASRAGHSKFPEDMEFAVVLPQGERGEAGKTAYESAVEHGYTGTEDGFYQALGNTNFAKEWADDVLKETTENFPSSSRKIDYHLEKEREAINKKSYPPIPFDAPMADRVQAIDRIEGEIEKTYRELGMDWFIDSSYYINLAIESALEVTSWNGGVPPPDSTVMHIGNYVCTTEGVDYGFAIRFKRLINVDSITAPELTYVIGVFRECSRLERIGSISFPEASTLTSLCVDCIELVSVEKVAIVSTSIDDWYSGCIKLKSAPAIDCSKTDYRPYGLLKGCVSLEHFGGLLSNRWIFNVAHCELLTVESLVNILEGLTNIDTGSQTATLGEINLTKLTDEQKAIAIIKGWILN